MSYSSQTPSLQFKMLSPSKHQASATWMSFMSWPNLGNELTEGVVRQIPSIQRWLLVFQRLTLAVGFPASNVATQSAQNFLYLAKSKFVFFAFFWACWPVKAIKTELNTLNDTLIGKYSFILAVISQRSLYAGTPVYNVIRWIFSA